MSCRRGTPGAACHPARGHVPVQALAVRFTLTRHVDSLPFLLLTVLNITVCKPPFFRAAGSSRTCCHQVFLTSSPCWTFPLIAVGVLVYLLL